MGHSKSSGGVGASCTSGLAVTTTGGVFGWNCASPLFTLVSIPLEAGICWFLIIDVVEYFVVPELKVSVRRYPSTMKLSWMTSRVWTYGNNVLPASLELHTNPRMPTFKFLTESW